MVLITYKHCQSIEDIVKNIPHTAFGHYSLTMPISREIMVLKPRSRSANTPEMLWRHTNNFVTIEYKNHKKLFKLNITLERSNKFKFQKFFKKFENFMVMKIYFQRYEKRFLWFWLCHAVNWSLRITARPIFSLMLGFPGGPFIPWNWTLSKVIYYSHYRFLEACQLFNIL